MESELRKAMHERLDQILDGQVEADPLEPVQNHLGRLASYPFNAHRTFREALELASDAMGFGVREIVLGGAYSDEADQRIILRSWLEAMIPLLYRRPNALAAILPKRQLNVFQVINAINALDAGEVQPIFEPKKGKARRANRWSLAQAKLEALAWKKRLIALGQTEKSANYAITVAFGEQWDTMRKWRLQCEEILGLNYVTWELEFAGSPKDAYMTKPETGMFGSSLRLDPQKGLEFAGTAYRNELRRSADLSKRKGRSASDQKAAN